MVKELSESDFDTFISKGDTVVDFYADWCGPCKMMEPHYKKAAEKYSKVKFAKVNVDKESDLAGRFNVMSIPTTIVFRDGDMVDSHTGGMGLEAIERLIKDNFS
jgi:thioredoxin 1